MFTVRRNNSLLGAGVSATGSCPAYLLQVCWESAAQPGPFSRKSQPAALLALPEAEPELALEAAFVLLLVPVSQTTLMRQQLDCDSVSDSSDSRSMLLCYLQHAEELRCTPFFRSDSSRIASASSWVCANEIFVHHRILLIPMITAFAQC